MDEDEDGCLAPVTPIKLRCKSTLESSISNLEAKTEALIQETMIKSSDSNLEKLGCSEAQASPVSSLKANTEAIQGSMMDFLDSNTAKLFQNNDLSLSCGVDARRVFTIGAVGGSLQCEGADLNCCRNSQSDLNCGRNSQSDFGGEGLNFTLDSKESQKQQGRKRKSIGIDLNKKPAQKVKVNLYRPKIYDASKPKKIPKEKIPKIPKEKKMRKKAEKQKKIPKEKKGKKVKKNVSKSEKTAELEMDPKTPCPHTPEPLASPALTPTSCKDITSEKRNSARFSHLRTTSVCRALNFKLEDPVQNWSDGDVNKVSVGFRSTDDLIDVNVAGSERLDGNVAPKGDCSLDGSTVREGGGRYGHVFDMLIPTLEEQDFECSIGMRKVLQDSLRFDALYFPQMFKKRRSKRQKKAITIKLFNGDTVHTKKRSRTRRGKTQNLITKLSQSLTTQVNDTRVQNFPTQSHLVQAPDALNVLPVPIPSYGHNILLPVPVQAPDALNVLPVPIPSYGHNILLPVPVPAIVLENLSQANRVGINGDGTAIDAPVKCCAHQCGQCHSLVAAGAELHHTPPWDNNVELQDVINLFLNMHIQEPWFQVPQHQDVNIANNWLINIQQPLLQPSYNVILRSDDATKGIDFIGQNGFLHTDDYKQDQCQSISGPLVLHQNMTQETKQDQTSNKLVLFRKKKKKPTSSKLVLQEMKQDQTSNKLVPFRKKKKKKPTHEIPRVDLDKETVQVWNMLMNIEKEEEKECGGDKQKTQDEEEEKKEWWAKEREFFGKRVESFIARMHLIQGNRRFSHWKGSVVDSVVGVFLTQNVSDKLSSSVYMTLASRFPVTPPALAPNGDCDENITSSPESVVSNIVMDECTQDSIGGNVRPTNDADDAVNQQSSHFDIELDINQKVDEKKEESSVTASDNTLLRRSSVQEDEVKEEPMSDSAIKSKKKKAKGKKKKQIPDNWDELRQTYSTNQARSTSTMDSVDWNAVSKAPVEDIIALIIDRGMHNNIGKNIKNFLDRMVKDHENIDLEWLRNVPPDKVKDYLLSINGLGLKSVECVRLLSLQHHAFPVDTNVARVVVRLGWVPLQPLPDNLQIDDLKRYPLVDSIQKYLWPRLCMLNQRTLYELHYQLITFGKVFCTMRQPNCTICPLRGECRYFANASTRGKFLLPGSQPEEKSIVTVHNSYTRKEENPANLVKFSRANRSFEPIVELPPSPQLESRRQAATDIAFGNFGELFGGLFEETDDENLWLTLAKLHQEITETESEILNSLDIINAGSNRKKKITSRLRIVHNAYELPDTHPLLQTFDKREVDDPCPYLLTTSSSGDKEKNSDEVSATILIPCRTAMRGSFPLNGTYFQVNEVFIDDETSGCPIRILRSELRQFRRRAVYCGKSATSIFKGLELKEIRYCFCQGFICVRSFNRRTRAPMPLPPKFQPPGGPKKNFKEKYEYDE